MISTSLVVCTNAPARCVRAYVRVRMRAGTHALTARGGVAKNVLQVEK